MKTAEGIIAEVKDILSTTWQVRNGIKVPEPESVTLGNDAVLLSEGTVLYADMADSTALVNGFKDWFAAEVYKSYLVAASHVIRRNSGTITAFDGDRVIAVYYGATKNSSAAKTALQLNWAVDEINKALKAKYPNSAHVGGGKGAIQGHTRVSDGNPTSRSIGDRPSPQSRRPSTRAEA